jgi:hypothetical protein
MPQLSSLIVTRPTRCWRYGHALAVGLAAGLTIGLSSGLAIAQAPASSFDAAAEEPPRWFVEQRPRAAAQQAVDLLARAASEGLNAGDYHAAWLRDAIERAGSGPVRQRKNSCGASTRR